jgi:hypothetical protein
VAGKPWTDEERAALPKATAGATSIGAAHDRFKAITGKDVTRAQFESALNRLGVRAADFPGSRYGKPEAVAPETSSAPPWQDYKPRPGWEHPAPLKPAKAKAADVITSIKITDVHSPFHHKRNVDCAIGIIRDVKADELDLMGDIEEMEALSMHPRSRPDLAKVAEEHYATNLLLDEIQNAHGGRKTRYLEGNHEHRAARFEAQYGQLDGSLSVPQALYIQPRADYHRETSQLRGIEWVPLKMQPLVVRNTALLHGVFEAQHHAFMMAQHLGPRIGAKHLFAGHMHTWQSATSNAGYTAYSCPWLGDERRHVFQAYVKGKPRPWQTGLVIVQECGDRVTVTPVFIENGRALFGGRLIEARAA